MSLPITAVDPACSPARQRIEARQAYRNSRVSPDTTLIAIDILDAHRARGLRKCVAKLQRGSVRTPSNNGIQTRYFLASDEVIPILADGVGLADVAHIRVTRGAELLGAQIVKWSHHDIVNSYFRTGDDERRGAHTGQPVPRNCAADLVISDLTTLDPDDLCELYDELYEARADIRWRGFDDSHLSDEECEALYDSYDADPLDTAINAAIAVRRAWRTACREALAQLQQWNSASLTRVVADMAQMRVKETDKQHTRPTHDADKLPSFAPELLSLPHGLAALQRYVLDQMIYPSPATAAVTALALLADFAMPRFTIQSYKGLGLNEQYMILAPTGFGKESVRVSFIELRKALEAVNPLYLVGLPGLQFSAPTSAQAAHKLLEHNNSQTFLSDEFAEQLLRANTDSHKQGMLVYFMESYSKALLTISVPHAVTNDYKPVNNPRALIVATSTSERMLEAFTASQAESGALNRFVIFPAEQHRIQKRYEGMVYEPSQEVIELLVWVISQGETKITFSADAWKLYMEHDSTVIEPLRFESNVLAGRLSEQAIKMAALIALSDRRTVIEARDLKTAYAIRQNIYDRAAALIGDSGAISGMHETSIAVEQLTKAFERVPSMPLAHLQNHSRKYRALDARSRMSIVQMLEANGVVRRVVGPRGGIVLSRIER